MAESMTIIITRKAKAMARAKQQIIPRLIGNAVLNEALDNFQRQGFLGDTFEPWRKRKQVGRKVNTRALLIRTGQGRRSLRVTRADQDIVGVGSNEARMKAHNEGSTERVAVRGHNRNRYGKEKTGTGIFSIKTKKEKVQTVRTIKGITEVKAHMRQNRLPKRQFLGKSQHLMNRLKRIYAAEINRAFNS